MTMEWRRIETVTIMIIIVYDDGVNKDRKDIMNHNTHIDANSVHTTLIRQNQRNWKDNTATAAMNDNILHTKVDCRNTQ